MEKKQPTTLLSLFKFITGLSFFAFLFWVCNAQDKKQGGPEATSTNQIKLNCVILQKAQMQRWVDSGWTDPAKPETLIKRILLQFYSSDATNAADNMQLTSYPAKTYLNAYSSGRENAGIDTTCVALMPTGKAILSNNYLSLKDLDILDGSGKLKDFTFIRLRPVQNTAMYGDYVTFNWEVVRVDEATNKETILKSGKTSDPCPTFCEETEG